LSVQAAFTAATEEGILPASSVSMINWISIASRNAIDAMSSTFCAIMTMGVNDRLAHRQEKIVVATGHRSATAFVVTLTDRYQIWRALVELNAVDGDQRHPALDGLDGGADCSGRWECNVRAPPSYRRARSRLGALPSAALFVAERSTASEKR
jgi:hypothetical protein